MLLNFTGWAQNCDLPLLASRVVALLVCVTTAGSGVTSLINPFTLPFLQTILSFSSFGISLTFCSYYLNKYDMQMNAQKYVSSNLQDL